MKDCDNSTRKIHISNNFIMTISLVIMFDTLLLRPSLHYNTPLHFTKLHFTTLPYTSHFYSLFIITILSFITLLSACFAIMSRTPDPLWSDRGTWITLVKLLIKSRTKNASPYKETDDGRVSFNMAKSLLHSVSSKLWGNQWHLKARSGSQTVMWRRWYSGTVVYKSPLEMPVRYKGSWIPDRVKVRIIYIDLGFWPQTENSHFCRQHKAFFLTKGRYLCSPLQSNTTYYGATYVKTRWRLWLSKAVSGNNYYYYYYYYYYYFSFHRPFLPGNSLEPKVIPTAQASSLTLKYFPYYVRCSKYSCLL